MELLKRCYHCHQTQNVSEFALDSSRGDGLNALCRSCCHLRYVSRSGGLSALRVEAPYLEHATKLLRYLDRWIRFSRVRATSAGVVVIDDITAIALLERLCDYKFGCAFCGEPANGWDHALPLSRGGAHCLSQVRPCCGSCNSGHGSKTLEEWDLAEFLLRRCNQPTLPPQGTPSPFEPYWATLREPPYWQPRPLSSPSKESREWSPGSTGSHASRKSLEGP